MNHIVERLLGPFDTADEARTHAVTEYGAALLARGIRPKTLGILDTRTQYTALSILDHAVRAHVGGAITYLAYRRKGASARSVYPNLSALVADFKADLNTEDEIWWYRPLITAMEEIADAIDRWVNEGLTEIELTALEGRSGNVRLYSSVNSSIIPVHAGWLAEKMGWRTKLVDGANFTDVELLSDVIPLGTEVAYAATGYLNATQARQRFTVYDALSETILRFVQEHDSNRPEADDGLLILDFAETKRIYTAGYVHRVGTTATNGGDPNMGSSLFYHFFSCLDKAPLVLVNDIKE